MFPQIVKMLQITKDIYAKQGFCDKVSITPEGSDIRETATEWARVSTLEVGKEGFREGRNVRHLGAKRPSWAARIIGRQIYQFTLVIMR